MKRPGNLFLVGMMGAGKTTVGRLLARRLKLRFVDSDHEIEHRCGVRVPTIFDIEGEAGFRVREAQTLAELTALEGIVLATGGGAVLAEDNRRRLANRGTVIYLCARPEDLYERVRQDPTGRCSPPPIRSSACACCMPSAIRWIAPSPIPWSTAAARASRRSAARSPNSSPCDGNSQRSAR